MLIQILFMVRILLFPYVPRHDSNVIVVWGLLFGVCVASAGDSVDAAGDGDRGSRKSAEALFKRFANPRRRRHVTS